MGFRTAVLFFLECVCSHSLYSFFFRFRYRFSFLKVHVGCVALSLRLTSCWVSAFFPEGVIVSVWSLWLLVLFSRIAGMERCVPGFYRACGQCFCRIAASSEQQRSFS